MKISDRFNLIKKLGQGTFSYIYEAYDKQMKQNVALKIEKKDKNKSILIFEYNVLNMLKGLSHVCSAYDFVKNSEQNLIVMDLLGNNLAKVRKCLEENYNFKIAVQLLIEMLDSIEEVHDRGFIHRDVKAVLTFLYNLWQSNFVLSRDNKHVFIVDFGLAKKHLDDNKNPVPQRRKADFRGTVSFASLNAHNNIDLSRRDDLWSLYFVILDFLNEKLKWREQKEYTMDEVKNIKTECLNNPEEKLWIATKDVQEVKNIFYHLKSLSYKDQPSYEYIRGQLKSILAKNIEIPSNYLNSFQNQAFIGTQRVSNAPIQQIFLQQHQQAPFTVFQGHYNAQKAIAIGAPPSAQTGNQEFQTPERPQNHHRVIQSSAAASVIHQQQLNTPLTPQSNQSLGLNEDGAFPKASPNHLINGTVGANGQMIQSNCNFQNNLPQQFFTTNMQQRKAVPGGPQQTLDQQPQLNSVQQEMNYADLLNQACAKRANLKRKNITQLEQAVRHEQQIAADQNDFGNNQVINQAIEANSVTPNQTKRTKQVTKQDKKPAANNTKKRETKKQAHIKIVQDEEPVNIQNLVENAGNDMMLTGSQKVQQANLTVPNNLPLFQFSPSNANCVNQQISISQNFYLHPQFLLLLNENENNGQLFSNNTPAQISVTAGQGFGSTTSATTAATTAGIINNIAATTVNTNQIIPSFPSGTPDPQQVHQQNVLPLSLLPQANLFNKIQAGESPQNFANAGQPQVCNQEGAVFQYGGNVKPSQVVENLLEEKNLEDMQQKGFYIQPTRVANLNGQNNQVLSHNSYFDLFTQNTIATKHRNANKKVHASNGYCYDPQRIEIQKIPCFKIEKIIKPQTAIIQIAADQFNGQIMGHLGEEQIQKLHKYK